MSFISGIISSSATFSAELKKVMADRNQLHFFCSNGLLGRHCEQRGKVERKDILFIQWYIVGFWISSIFGQRLSVSFCSFPHGIWQAWADFIYGLFADICTQVTWKQLIQKHLETTLNWRVFRCQIGMCSIYFCCSCLIFMIHNALDTIEQLP